MAGDKQGDNPRRDRFVIAKYIGVCLAIGGVLLAEWWADPGKEASPVDRIFLWAFVAFAVGLVELFLLFVGLAVLGRIDLPSVFEDKDGQLTVDHDDSEPRFVRAVAGRGSVSLSRLQAFLWTLVIMVIYFHKAVIDGHGTLPSMPSELLLVMGISGAVYLASKDIAARDGTTTIVQSAPRATTPGPADAAGQPAVARPGTDPTAVANSNVEPVRPSAETAVNGEPAKAAGVQP
jgi:hypothetical protein